MNKVENTAGTTEPGSFYYLAAWMLTALACHVLTHGEQKHLSV